MLLVTAPIVTPKPAGCVRQDLSRQDQLLHAPVGRFGDVEFGLGRARERVRAGEEDPPCETCGGILKSATISFGQALVPEVIDRAMQAATAADLFLSVGTSLQVYPVAGAVPAARSAGAKIVIVNAQPTPFDDIADAVLSGSIGAILPGICGGA